MSQALLPAGSPFMRQPLSSSWLRTETEAGEWRKGKGLKHWTGPEGRFALPLGPSSPAEVELGPASCPTASGALPGPGWDGTAASPHRTFVYLPKGGSEEE